MRDRIRNILLESLILESPIFRAVAIKYKGKVYEGEPWMVHASIIDEIFGQDAADEYISNMWMDGVEDGYVTVDGRFVTRAEAKNLVGEDESGLLRDMEVLESE
jgi:hypothetical protein